VTSRSTVAADFGATLPRRYGRAAAAPAVIAVVLFFIAPLVYFLRYSLQTPTQAGFANPTFTFENFAQFFSDPYYTAALLRTVIIAAAATVLTLILALPAARMISKSSSRAKSWLIIGAVFPLLVGSVIRSIGWVALLGYSGVVNSALTATGIIKAPIQMLQSPITVTIAIASVVLPVMILVLQSSMESVAPATERAAMSLGARPTRVFWQVTVPQIVPGIITGTTLTFVMCLNAYATPLLVGSNRVPMLAPIIYSSITVSNNWPFGAVVATILLVLCLATVVLVGWFLRSTLDSWRKAER
jgi:putative spermidine/putrescine transport system permease protein